MGFIKAQLKTKKMLHEKGVDVALASKMVQLSTENKIDKVILFSADYDYAYALKLIKDNMTKVHIVKMYKGKPPTNRNMSFDLSIIADKIIPIYSDELKKFKQK